MYLLTHLNILDVYSIDVVPNILILIHIILILIFTLFILFLSHVFHMYYEIDILYNSCNKYVYILYSILKKLLCLLL